MIVYVSETAVKQASFFVSNKYFDMNSQQKTKARIENIKKLSDEERAEIHSILNDFIAKNRTKHYNILSGRLNRVFKFGIDDETVEDNLQNIYVYMYLNPETVKSFNETGCLNRLFNALAYNISLVGNISKKYGRELPMIENVDFEYEESSHGCSFESLCPDLTNEERLEYHRIALDELKEYLLDNPQSKLKSALDIIKKEYNKPTYDVALNYAATPSYKFLETNKAVLGIKNVQNNVDKFKKVCERVYGKELVWNGQSSVKHF